VLDCVRQDVDRYCRVNGRRSLRVVVGALLFDNGLQAVLLHRLAHELRRRRVPALGPLVARLSLFLTGVDISPTADIGPGLYVAHGVGLVVGGSARVGARAFLLQQATIGAPSQARLGEMPVLGDDVFVGAGARLIGPIRIGHRVFVGTNAVVTCDLPDDARAVSAAGLEVTGRTPAAGPGAAGAGLG
jgi:serine O-acetyltransferase